MQVPAFLGERDDNSQRGVNNLYFLLIQTSFSFSGCK